MRLQPTGTSNKTFHSLLNQLNTSPVLSFTLFDFCRRDIERELIRKLTTNDRKIVKIFCNILGKVKIILKQKSFLKITIAVKTALFSSFKLLSISGYFVHARVLLGLAYINMEIFIFLMSSQYMLTIKNC